MVTSQPHSSRHPVVPSVLILAVMALVATWASPAEAIPAFARKYQTSCQTCHIAYPKLNPFGETFRLLGYRMPDETEDMVKEPPVQLGAPGYKRLFPDTVWPSTIPGNMPLSLDLTLTNLSRRTTEAGMAETITNDFRFPEEVGLVAGGTLGETLSFLGEVAFETEAGGGRVEVAIEIEHAQLTFNGPFGWGPAFNLKVGRFAPEVTQPLSHSHVLTTSGAASSGSAPCSTTPRRCINTSSATKSRRRSSASTPRPPRRETSTSWPSPVCRRCQRAVSTATGVCSAPSNAPICRSCTGRSGTAPGPWAGRSPRWSWRRRCSPSSDASSCR